MFYLFVCLAQKLNIAVTMLSLQTAHLNDYISNWTSVWASGGLSSNSSSQALCAVQYTNSNPGSNTIPNAHSSIPLLLQGRYVKDDRNESVTQFLWGRRLPKYNFLGTLQKPGNRPKGAEMICHWLWQVPSKELSLIVLDKHSTPCPIFSHESQYFTKEELTSLQLDGANDLGELSSQQFPSTPHSLFLKFGSLVTTFLAISRSSFFNQHFCKKKKIFIPTFLYYPSLTQFEISTLRPHFDLPSPTCNDLPHCYVIVTLEFKAFTFSLLRVHLAKSNKYVI